MILHSLRWLSIKADALFDSNEVKLPKPPADNAKFQSVLSIVFTIAGAVAVIMVVLGGISYILSAGDPQKTAKAKDTILYAVIGLAVAILANVIVVFVIGKVMQ